MAEQQLIDYIKKAREAGQSDDQTRDLLYKNGWTLTEVNEAIMVLINSQPQPQSQPQEQPQPQVATQPEPQLMIQPEIQQQPNTQPPAQALSNDLLKAEEQQQDIKLQSADLSTVGAQPQSQPEAQPEIQLQPINQPQEQPQEVKPQVMNQPQIVSQPEAQYKPQFAQTNMPRMRGGFLPAFLKILIILIIVIAICGVGYITAGQYYNLPYSNSLFNLFKQEDPQTVISNMLKNMKDVKSSHTIMQLEVNAINNGTSQGKLVLNTNSETDITDVKNTKSGGNFTINLTTPGSTSPMVSGTVSLAVIGSTYYIKIGNDIVIPAAYLSSSSPEFDISKIKGKWLEINEDSIKTLSQANGGEIVIPDISQTSNSELIKKMQDLIVSENIFSVSKKLNDETISGQDTYHYLVIISKDKLTNLLNKIIAESFKAQNNVTGETSGSNSILMENMVQAFVKTFTDSVGDINIETWIGKKDYMLYQVKLDKNIDVNKILGNIGAGASVDSSMQNMQIGIKFSMTNSNFNKPITVQVPTGAQKIEELVLPLIKIQNINNDIKQIGNNAEYAFFANKSYSSLCSRGLLNGYLKTYGTDLIRLNGDIVKQGAKKPICFSNVNNYCISTQLIDGSYSCIDKNGRVGTVKCVSAQTVCFPPILPITQ
ncbi:MAG: hypothetical protein NT094_04015 [Candidatus Staskawiczbacteria bacterium]|nr:hypothetical protein [Candidatus Staskawiczbacteria bacterium]